ncbi:MAG: ArgR family transcriptional regulator [Oscillospiraceae bacterium]|nr:ArgR family transcriptional regulator [Oscillospiraceae bacterium]
MSNPRHKAILRLIAEHEIGTQEMLREMLNADGYDVTQATISRDIHQLKLRKVRGRNGSKYARATVSDAPSKLLEDVVCKVDFAMNTVVLQCHSGTAQAAAAVLDGMNLPDVVGSIAGDDTIFLLARSEDTARSLVQTLQEQIFG